MTIQWCYTCKGSLPVKHVCQAPPPPQPAKPGPRNGAAVLGAMLAFAGIMHFETGFYSHFGLVLVVTGVAWIALALLKPTAAGSPGWLPPTWFSHALMLCLVVGAVADIESGPPHIDVYDYQVQAADRLTSGQRLNDPENPYDEGGRTSSAYYPYMPFEALLRAPFAALDVRYAGLVALVAAYPLMTALGRQHGFARSDLVASAALLAGSPLVILHNCWSEPLVLPFLAGGLLALKRWPTLGFVLLGLAAAVKLWLLILIPYAWSLKPLGGIISAAAAFATALPFLLQNPILLVQGTLLFHLGLPQRFDGLTLSHLAWWWPTVAGTGIWGLVGLHMLTKRYDVGRGLLVVVLSLVALFLLGPQGNPNYWWLLAPMLGLAYLVGVQVDSDAVDGRVGPRADVQVEHPASRADRVVPPTPLSTAASPATGQLQEVLRASHGQAETGGH